MRELKPTNIRLVWDSIVPGIAAALEKGGGDWRIEDAYASCVAGESHLYLADTGAFCILQMQFNDLLVQKECWVWIAYVPPGESLAPYFEQVAAIARDAGAERLRFESKRAGWERTPGWEMVSSNYVREL